MSPLMTPVMDTLKQDSTTIDSLKTDGWKRQQYCCSWAKLMGYGITTGRSRTIGTTWVDEGIWRSRGHSWVRIYEGPCSIQQSDGCVPATGDGRPRGRIPAWQASFRALFVLMSHPLKPLLRDLLKRPLLRILSQWRLHQFQSWNPASLSTGSADSAPTCTTTYSNKICQSPYKSLNHGVQKEAEKQSMQKIR